MAQGEATINRWIGGTRFKVADLRAAIDGLADDARILLAFDYSGQSDEMVSTELAAIRRDPEWSGHKFEGLALELQITTPCEDCRRDPCDCERRRRRRGA
ncbi:MAG: hypothetical protein U0790_00310 [Isosphaeraceae bacterium]